MNLVNMLLILMFGVTGRQILTFLVALISRFRLSLQIEPKNSSSNLNSKASKSRESISGKKGINHTQSIYYVT